MNSKDDNVPSLSSSVSELTHRLTTQTKELLESLQPVIDSQLEDARQLAAVLKTQVLTFDSLMQPNRAGTFSGVKITPKKITKDAQSLTINADIQSEYALDNLTFIEREFAVIKYELSKLSQAQLKILERIESKSSLAESSNIVEDAKLKLGGFAQHTLRLDKGVLVINGTEEIIFEPTSRQGILLSLFFTIRAKAKSTIVHFDEVYDVFEPNWINLSKSNQARLKKSVFDARRQINNKVRIKLLTADELLIHDGDAIYLNLKVR